tara:strand:- start:13 stop:1026 length:1014 start_codon:yes stop_codon:yes gene_type:complete
VDAKLTHEFRKVYADIINGYTLIESEGRDLYIRHLNESDIGYISSKYKLYFSQAEEKGLLSAKKKLELLKEQGIWAEEEEQYINLKEELSRNTENKKKLLIRSQIDTVSKLIEEQEQELQSIEAKRTEAIDLTCEKYADRKSNEEIVNLCLYKDPQLKEKFFSTKEYREMDQAELYACIFLYNNSLSSFNGKFIKQLAAMPFFINSFLISNDDPMIFFGKPVVDLTNYQIDLFSTGKFYKSVMSSKGNPPEEAYEDPQKLVEWYDSAQSSEEMKKQTEGKEASTFVGATKEEMDQVAKDDPNAINLNKEVAKEMKQKGTKALELKDIMKIHGYNVDF